ncbi:MAG: N-formylglutamate amidohydrolase [Micavibrio sp.]|nr:N-formylglutamate amidohydrolase [Micavibrio sp.]
MGILKIEKPLEGRQLPIIFDSPHSGRIYPENFCYACDFAALQTAEDHYVEELFASAPTHGAYFLHALFPRSYIDTNRAIDDIDLALMNEDWNGPFPTFPSSRSDSGIGLIRRLVKPGLPVYDRYLNSDEILHRINRYYVPYHDALEKLIADAHYNFGQVWHINCHSMPHSTAFPRNTPTLIGNQVRAADFVIGDRDGTCAELGFSRALRNHIKSMGYFVTLNDPFKGVEILQRHAAPARGINSIQLEINKALYMDEKTGAKNGNFDKLKSDVDSIMTFITDYAKSNLTKLAAD